MSWTSGTRQRWVEVLSRAPPAWARASIECADHGVLALEYSLENSQLSVLTTRVEKSGVHS